MGMGEMGYAQAQGEAGSWWGVLPKGPREWGCAKGTAPQGVVRAKGMA